MTPLTDLTRKGRQFEWSEECEKAFRDLKENICCEPVLAFPDFQLPFWLSCDASRDNIGAVLEQDQNGVRPIGYFSMKLRGPQGTLR